jgi:hypothetical protein
MASPSTEFCVSNLDPSLLTLQVPVVVVTPDTGTLGDVSAASDDPLALRLRNVTWKYLEQMHP